MKLMNAVQGSTFQKKDFNRQYEVYLKGIYTYINSITDVVFINNVLCTTFYYLMIYLGICFQ